MACRAVWSDMSVQDLPYTAEWRAASPGWVPSEFTATGYDEAAAHLRLIDQRELPRELVYVDCFTSAQVCDAIADLTVRGAPALGISGAFACVLWAKNEWPVILSRKRRSGEGEAPADEQALRAKFLGALKRRATEVASTRPTAVNLSWGTKQVVRRAQELAREGAGMARLVTELEALAVQILHDDEETCRKIGANGAKVFAELARELGRPIRVETHCNAGSLATARWGTATAAIYAAFDQGNIERVYVDETRPVDQGARLTAWEMGKAGVPYTLICDDMAGAVMQAGKVDAVIVGADRIARNNDTANKIGTYQLAVLAKHHGIPFYVAAPRTTFDETIATGEEIRIEQRDPQEVRCMPSGREWLPVAPQGCEVYNPAFDVTPGELITAIITEEAPAEGSEE